MNPWMRAAMRAELGLAREARGVDRRSFVQIIASATGGLWLATQLPSLAAAADAPAAPPPQLYIRIDPDNRITLMIPNSEIGQGVRTSLAMLMGSFGRASAAVAFGATPSREQSTRTGARRMAILRKRIVASGVTVSGNEALRDATVRRLRPVGWEGGGR